MLELASAAAGFAVIHLFVSGTRLRDDLVARYGERAYLGGFSLASAGLLAWLIFAFGDARQIALTPLTGYRWIGLVVMLLAFVLVVLGLLTRAPTAVGGEKLLAQDDPARGIHRVTRHPFLWGTALWAATHMVFNPEASNLVFFGTFLLVALTGTVAIDAKRARRFGADWRRYAERTSNIPFAAIAGGRNRLVVGELGWGRLLAALALFALFVVLHLRFFSVAAF